MIAKETTVTFFVEAHHSMHARGTMSTKDITIDLSCAVNRRYGLLHHSVCSLIYASFLNDNFNSTFISIAGQTGKGLPAKYILLE